MTGATIASTIPNTFYEWAFNADPNQNVLPPYWQDLSARVQFAWDTKRGRPNELEVNETGEWNHRLVNFDGALDPSNGSSPFAPNVRLYRQCRIRVQVAPTQNLAPRVTATGSASMDVVHDAVSNWWYATGAGSIAQANYLTAAPSGQTTALAWTTPAGTTSANAVLWDGVNPGNALGPVGDNFQVAAGQQYTVSRYLSRVASADATVQVTLTITWFNSAGAQVGVPSAGGAVTVPTVTSWARGTATGTAPAGAVWGRVSMAITTPASTTASNTIYVTGCQDEQAGAATAWADPGPTNFIFSGMEERWPQAWTEQNGTYGTSEPVGVDALGALAVFTLKDPFINELLALNPNFLYALNDPKGSAVCADASGKRVAAPVENSPAGQGSLTFGNSVQASSSSGLMLGTAGPVATFNNNSGGAGQPVQEAETFVSIHKTTVAPGPPSNGNWTRLIHFRCATAPAAGNFGYALWEALPQTVAQVGNTSAFDVGIDSGGLMHFAVGAGTGGVAYDGPTNVCDGNWHQAAVTCDSAGNVKFYVDGAAVTPTSGSTPITLPISAITSDVLGASVQIGATYYRAGTVGDVALACELPFAAAAAQITNLYNSFRSASSGDSSGGRYQRVLNWVGWTGKSRIDTGQTSSMGPATDLTGSTALDALNSIALTENGDSYAGTDGALVFKARSARYNSRTPVAIFGEGAPVGQAGEWPCEIAAIEYDPSHLAGRVEVTQYQGPVFVAQDAASGQRYFPRTYQRTINVTSPNEAQDAATYLLSQLKDPHLRADSIHLHPSAVPGLFAVCVTLEKGQRIRLIKRPPDAPAITVDAFIEQLNWSWDPDTGDVFLDLQASPADLANYWQLGALHGTLNAQANAGTNTVTINALPDSAYNVLAASLPGSYSLTFEPGTARAETIAIAAQGIPATNIGYSTATITLAANLAFTHPAGSVWCEPLPAGYTDPTTWDASSILGAANTTLNQPATAGTNTITINALPDVKLNAAASDWSIGDLLQVGAGTPNFEGYNLLSPNQATAGEGVFSLPAGSDGNSIGITSAYSGTVPVTASASAFQGSNVWQVAVSASAASGNRLIRVTKAAAAGQPFTWSIYVRSATTGANPLVHPEIQWLNANGGLISTTTGSTVTLTGGPSAGWTRLTLSVTAAPAGAVWAVPSVRLDPTTPTSAWTFQADGLQWEANSFASTFQVCPQVLSVAATVPGYSTVVITLAANLANNHSAGELVCDPLPPGVTTIAQLAATTRLAYANLWPVLLLLLGRTSAAGRATPLAAVLLAMLGIGMAAAAMCGWRRRLTIGPVSGPAANAVALGAPRFSARVDLSELIVGMAFRARRAVLVALRKLASNVLRIRHRLAVLRLAAPAVAANEVIERQPVGDRPSFALVEQPIDVPHAAPVPDLWPAVRGMGTQPPPAFPRLVNVRVDLKKRFHGAKSSESGELMFEGGDR